jgi:hypothetical protein
MKIFKIFSHNITVKQSEPILLQVHYAKIAVQQEFLRLFLNEISRCSEDREIVYSPTESAKGWYFKNILDNGTPGYEKICSSKEVYDTDFHEFTIDKETFFFINESDGVVND